MGELAFGRAHPLAGGEHAGLLAPLGRGAGGDLGPPPFLGGQRGLIADDQTTIGELANRLGYRSEAAFARAFKRVLGAPPGAVRATRA